MGSLKEDQPDDQQDQPESTAPGENPPPLESQPTDQQPLTQPDREAQPVDDEQPPRLPFPVVGVGASAGGLEAFTEFLETMRPDSGMAFVLILHLTPDRHSMVAEILGRKTKMRVAEVDDGMEVLPNHVYVIRPAHVLTIKEGRLHLGPRLDGPRAADRPVDDFFKSLAQEQRERAIAIIMSGMGSNGAAGAQAIKAVGGLCIAQDPESAQFPSMPRHLIDAGYADFISRPKDMPELLLQYARHPYATGAREADAETILQRHQQGMREIMAVLRTRTKQDFSGYKKPTILRRIQRRMGLARMTKIDDYAKMLRQSPSEVNALADDLLIHVTGFFRDPEAWETLRARVIVPLIAARANDSAVRCWVTACSSGEEAYSLAMLLVEEAERTSKQLDIKIFATDMADRTLANARNGIYPGGIEADINPDRLARFFEKDDATYRVRQDLRECVVFAPQNILQDPPFSRLDIASCRNLLIYLEPDVQQRVLALLHFGLREGGMLFLGTSETLGGSDELFEALDKKARIFRRVGPTRHGMVDFPLPPSLRAMQSVGGNGGGEVNTTPERRPGFRPTYAQLTQRTLLDHHLPAAVLIDRDNRIVYFQGNTRPFLEQPSGEPTRDLMTLAREGVRGSLRMALHRAAADNATARADDGWIETQPGRRSRLSVIVSPVLDKSTGDYFVVSFELNSDTPSPDEASLQSGADQSTTDDLRRMRDELQSTIEELQTSNEELKASHEEVVSINEELQSSNEELETSKEEMQSLNEELTTVNAQLQAKMEEHQAANNDLTSLLASTDIGVLFLDTRLRIRRFTPATRDLLDMIATDIGRPLSDLAAKFNDPRLTDDARAVLDRLVPIEREVSAQNGRWFMRRVLPYRTAENRIDGVVVTFTDISGSKRTAQTLAETARLLDLSGDAIIVRDVKNRIVYWNHGATEMFGWTPEEAVGKDQHALLKTEMEEPLETLTRRLRETDSLTGELVQRTRDGRRITVLCRWSLDRDAEGNPASILTTMTDITDRKRADTALRESEEHFRLVVEGVRDFAMFTLGLDNRVTSWNPAAERLLGWSEAEAIGQSAAMIFTPEDRAAGAVEKELGEAARTGCAQDERWHVKKDGTRFWGSGVMSAVRGEGGKPKRFVKVFRDETTRKRAEDALAEAARSAEVANRVKDEFLATLAHELRTPLSAILLWSGMLRNGKVAPEEFNDGLDAIQSSAEAQKTLIEDLLDTSRIETGKLWLQLREVELASAVREAVDAIMATASAKGVTVKADYGKDVGVVSADSDRLRQVIWNLLTNAVKFTPSGGGIEVRLERHANDGVEIRVADTGSGIEPPLLPHVFDRFRQADSSFTRSHGGLGLGLAITKQLVELHGGTIRAQSPGPGKGATFTVRLPLPKLHRGSHAGNTKTRDTAAASGETRGQGRLDGIRVLLIGDDAGTRTALERLLRDAGIIVTSAAEASSAFDAFQKNRPDVIVSDIGLPGEDGNALIRRIRACEAEDQPAKGTSPARSIPAIALTAFAREADRRRSLEAGFDEHVAKPVNPDQLLAAVQAALNNAT